MSTGCVSGLAVHESRTRADADQAPDDSEHGGAEQQTFVDTRADRQRDVLAEQVPLFGRTK
jgi:hypothetical protein